MTGRSETQLWPRTGSRAGGFRTHAAVAAWMVVGLTACAGAEDAARQAREQELQAQFGRQNAESSPVVTSDAGGSPTAEDVPPGGRADPPVPRDQPVSSSTRSDDDPRPLDAPPPSDAAGPGREGADAELPEETPVPASANRREVEAGSAIDPDSILALADRAYQQLNSLRASFAQRIENPLIDRFRESIGKWYQVGRGRFRMASEDPPDDVFVADGTCFWAYEPSIDNQVLVTRLDEGGEIGTVDILGQLLSQARVGYAGVYVGSEMIDGVTTHQLALVPRELPARYVNIRLWIGEADHLVRRFRIEEENQLIRTVTLTDLEPQAAIANAVFEFTPPAGVQIYPDDVQCG